MQPEQKISWSERWRQSADVRRQRRLQRKNRPPWIWRRWPEGKRKWFTVVFGCLGGVAYFVCFQAVIFGMIFAPVEIASGHTGSSLENTMRCYVHLFPNHSIDSTYVLAQVGITGVLFYFMGIFNWLTRNRRENAQENKSDVVQ